jgi:hypothetical protein
MELFKSGCLIQLLTAASSSIYGKGDKDNFNHP